MDVWGPVGLYLLVVTWSALVAMPLCRAMFGDVRRIPLFSVALTLGWPLVILAFSLLARVNPEYAITVPVMLIGLSLLSGMAWVLGRQPAARAHGTDGAGCSWDWRADGVLITAFVLMLLLMLLLRSTWPGIHWSSTQGEYGVEKMFNFSMIQAFVFGSGFPPENLWNAGEPIAYYILFHALPGLTAWGWRMLGGGAGAGDVLFVFSDTFTLLLGSLSLAVWTHALLTRLSPALTRRQVLAIGLGLALLVFLGTHLTAVIQVLGAWLNGANPGWWGDFRFGGVPWTQTHYPFWVLTQGDHHAFQRVFVLQIALFGVMVLVLRSGRFHPARAALLGLLAAATLLAHPMSVLFNLLVMVPAVLALILYRLGGRAWRSAGVLLANLAAAGGLALLLSLPRLLEYQSTAANWYFVEKEIASPFFAFIGVQFPVLILAGLAALAGCAARQWHCLPERTLLRNGLFWILLALSLLMLLLGRDGAAVALLCAAPLLLWAPRQRGGEADSDAMPAVILAAAGFLVWFIPEFLVLEFPRWGEGSGKRFNVTMRFWLEAYYLLPFLTLLAWAPALPAALASRAYRWVLALVLVPVVLLWLMVHAYTVHDRQRLVPDPPGINGSAFIGRDHAADWTIIQHLRAMPDESIRLGELCGTGEVIQGLPRDFDWPGRIAAFSGRPGICGWTAHIWQFSKQLVNEWPTGPWTWVRFREYERALQQAYVATGLGQSAPEARILFQQLGITHLVVGEQEQRIFPDLDVRALAEAVGGSVVLDIDGGLGIVGL